MITGLIIVGLLITVGLILLKKNSPKHYETAKISVETEAEKLSAAARVEIDKLTKK